MIVLEFVELYNN